MFHPQKLDPSPLMQRRTAKSSAHIAPPTPGIPPSAVLSSVDKQPSRLNQRTLGLPNRIWLILTLFLSILVFTRLILPSHNPDATYFHRNPPNPYSTTLHPINYLNLTDADEAAQNPFPFCPTFGKGDVLAEKYGPLAISKSWVHLGSGARVQQVIHKALLGQPVTISIIGGSGEHISTSFCLEPVLTSTQSLRVMAQAKIQSRLSAIPLVSSTGGIPSFPIPPLSSLTVPFGEPTPSILPSAMLIISLTIPIS
jgi:hypothetical protein